MTFQWRRRAKISQGELIRTLADLRPETQQQKELVANLLGFDDQNSFMATSSRIVAGANHDPLPESKANLPTRGHKISSPNPPTPPILLPETSAPGTLEEINDTTQISANFGEPLPGFERYDETESDALPQETLIPQKTIRGVLSSMLQITRKGHIIDIYKLVRQVENGLPPAKMPYLQSSTIAHGCQLLLDFSDSMTPWINDMHALKNELVNLMGSDLVSIYHFDELPMEAEGRAMGSKVNKHTLEPPKPILVITDFGLSDTTTAYRLKLHWQNFINRCEDAGTPLICLVPWWIPPIIEQSLGHYPYFFHWLPDTTASKVKSLIGNGHRLES